MKQDFLTRDRIITALNDSGKIRIALIRNLNTVLTAQKRHNLEILPAFYLARTLTAASLMASSLKGEERIVIETISDGLINKIYAEAMQNGEVRGFVEYDKINVNKSFQNTREILGEGILKVSKILYNKGEPIVGIVELQKGDIVTDVSYYFAQSEQIPSAVILDVDFDQDGLIANSAGLLIQAMPGATIDEVVSVHKQISEIKNLSAIINSQPSLEKAIDLLLPFPTKKLKTMQIDFFCRCSKDKFISKLMTLKPEEIIEMKKANNNELVCQYCNAHYYLEDEDFDKILAEIIAKSN